MNFKHGGGQKILCSPIYFESGGATVECRRTSRLATSPDPVSNSVFLEWKSGGRIEVGKG